VGKPALSLCVLSPGRGGEARSSVKAQEFPDRFRQMREVLFNMSKGGSTLQIARKLAEAVAEGLGVYIWDIQYLKEGASWYLRALIDKDGGITLKDCEDFHRAFGAVLDKEDPIEGNYWLEVASPGLERELNKDWHFEKLIGERIQVKLIRPKDGQSLFIGELRGKDADGIKILTDSGEEALVAPKEAAWVRQYYDFDKGDSKDL
jgi:ribosome maturation factor RimP